MFTYGFVVLLLNKSQGEDALFYHLKGVTTYFLKLLRGIDAQYSPLPDSKAFPWLRPEKSAAVGYGNTQLGYLSVLHPNVKQHLDKKLNIALLEINFDFFFDIQEQPVQYNEISKYPEVSLDFSFLADRNTRFIDMDNHVAAFKNPLLLGYRYVTMFEGKNIPEGKKSLTFAFKLGSKEKTLLTEDITLFLNQLIAHMEKKEFVLRKS